MKKFYVGIVKNCFDVFEAENESEAVQAARKRWGDGILELQEVSPCCKSEITEEGECWHCKELVR